MAGGVIECFKTIIYCCRFLQRQAFWGRRILLSTSHLLNSPLLSPSTRQTFSESDRFLAGGGDLGLVISPDGAFAYVSESAESSVVKYNLSTGKPVAIFATPAHAGSIVLSPDGTTLYALAGSINFFLCAFNTSTGAQTGSVQLSTDATQVVVSPDCKALYLASSGAILHFDALTLRSMGRIPTNDLFPGLAFGPSSTTLYVLLTGNLYGISFVDTASDTVTGTIPLQNWVYAMAVSPDGSILYVASLGLIEISTATEQIVRTLDSAQNLETVAISPNGKNALCVLIGHGIEFDLVEIDLSSGNPIQTVGVEGNLSGAVYAPSGTQVYALLGTTFDVDYANESGDAVSGFIHGVVPSGPLVSSLDGDTIAGTYYGRLYTVDTASKNITSVYQYSKSFQLGEEPALNSNSTVALVGLSESESLGILNLSSGAWKVVPVPFETQLSIAISPDDRTAYVASGALCSVDISTATVNFCGPQLVQDFVFFRVIAIDSTGMKLFVISGTTVNVYDSSSLNPIQPKIELPVQAGVAITYSAVNNCVYVVSDDPTRETNKGMVYRIDADSFLVTASQALTGQPSDVAVSKDGTRVYIAEPPFISTVGGVRVGGVREIPILDGTTLAPIGQIADVEASSLVSAN